MTESKGFYIGKEYLTPSENIHEIRNPYDGKVVARINMAGEREREIAVSLADQSFNKIRKIHEDRRIEILESFRNGINKRSEEIARAIALEAGKPIKLGRAEIQRALQTVELSIDVIKSPEIERFTIDTIPCAKPRYSIVQRFSVGPVLGITPFNFPINLVMHKLAPAIAAGCPFILKPASQVASTALILGEILHEIETEPGQVTIIPMSSKVVDPLCQDDRLKLITFTGSAEVGWSIKARSKKTRVALELGGNAGCIVEPDAFTEWAVDRCIMGGFSFQGQVCISLQRLYIHEKIYDDFMSLFIEKAKKLKMGDPLDESTELGPMISENDAIRVISWLDEASQAGGKILCGGNRNGSMVEASIIENPPMDSKVVSEEVFGPVVAVFPYKDFDQAVEAVGNTRFGLQAGIFTHDMKKANDAFLAWQVGGVIVNDVPTFRVDRMPYGGSKDSGIGREGPRYAVEEMTERRIMVVNEP